MQKNLFWLSRSLIPKIQLFVSQGSFENIFWSDRQILPHRDHWENYSTRGTDISTILVDASRSVPHNLQDHPLIYGDYYFVETLVRLLRPDLEEMLFPRQVLEVG